MLTLILTILSTTAIGVVVKLARDAHQRTADHAARELHHRFGDQRNIVVTYGQDFSLSGAALIMAPIGGFIFAMNFFLMILAIKKRGVALPVTLMRLSAVVPVTASILLFSESPSIAQAMGAAGALAAAALLSIGVKGGEEASGKFSAPAIILILTSLGLLFCFGLADLIMKLFEQLGNTDEKPLFLALLFGLAAIFVLAALLKSKAGITLVDFAWGIALGVPNLLASYFIVSALHDLPAYIVFPTVSAGTVMLITIIAILGFKERLTNWGVAGIILTLISIIALNR